MRSHGDPAETKRRNYLVTVRLVKQTCIRLQTCSRIRVSAEKSESAALTRWHFNEWDVPLSPLPHSDAAAQPPHLHLLSSVLPLPSLSLVTEEEEEEEEDAEEGGGGGGAGWWGGLNKGFIERRDGRRNGGMTFWTMSVTVVMCELVSCWVSS